MIRWVLIAIGTILFSALRGQEYYEFANAELAMFIEEINDSMAPAMIQFEVTVPIKNGPKTWLVGLSHHEYDRFVFTNVYEYTIVGGYGYSWDRRNTTYLIGLPRAVVNHGDNITAWQMGEMLVHEVRYRKGLKLKLGIYHRYEEYGEFFMPLVGGYWKPARWFDVEGLLPRQVKINFSPTPTTRISLVGGAAQYTYRSLAGMEQLNELQGALWLEGFYGFISGHIGVGYREYDIDTATDVTPLITSGMTLEFGIRLCVRTSRRY